MDGVQLLRRILRLGAASFAAGFLRPALMVLLIFWSITFGRLDHGVF